VETRPSKQTESNHWYLSLEQTGTDARAFEKDCLERKRCEAKLFIACGHQCDERRFGFVDHMICVCTITVSRKTWNPRHHQCHTRRACCEGSTKELAVVVTRNLVRHGLMVDHIIARRRTRKARTALKKGASPNRDIRKVTI